MSEASTSAMLVGTPEMFADRANAITATIPRGEIAEALASEPPADLVLDVLRARPGSEDPERRTVNITWTQNDLESLLGLPGDDAVTFYFDPTELDRLLEDAEVEGHGLRETAVVLSIAAAAAVGAGNAFASPPDLSGAPGGNVAVAATHDEATSTERGIGLQAVASTHDEAGSAARGIEPGTVPASHDESTLVARGVEHQPALHDEATFAARGIEPGSAAHDEASLVARGIVEDTPAVSDTGSGIEFPSVDPGTAAAVTGGLAAAGLLIVGAAFATRRRELGHP
jgi:MYXO-CTERM domain-containing protein